MFHMLVSSSIVSFLSMIKINLSDLAQVTGQIVSFSDIVPRFLAGSPLLGDPKKGFRWTSNMFSVVLSQ